MASSEKREQMVFTHTEEVDIPHNHHLVILDGSERGLQALAAKITGMPATSARRKGWFARAIVDPLRNMMGAESRKQQDPLMLPPAVVGGEHA